MVECSICNKSVFHTEEIHYQSKVYHKSCFKCTYCRTLLNLRNVRSFNKVPYCIHHSPSTNQQTVQPKIDLVSSEILVVTQKPDVSERPKGSEWSVALIDSKSRCVDQNNDRVLTNCNKIVNSGHRETLKRASILASGFNTYQSQIDVAGQIFTVDPLARQKILRMFDEFNIIICGGPRVGKSTLINGIFGSNMAKSSSGLDSCTKATTFYSLKGSCKVDDELITYTYNFWDTPGFESWKEADIRSNFNEIMRKPKSEPLCIIYCASPGSFADTEQIKWLLNISIKENNIFVALVVTNKWAGQKEQRNAIVNKYKELLSNYHQQTNEEDGITYFGNVGLCTMINAVPYVDEELDIFRDIEGVDELIEGIMSCLDDDGKVFHWCMVVMQKRGISHNFKAKMKKRFSDFTDFIMHKFQKNKIQ